MDYAEAIDTQRDALLRLLARLVVAVEILSCALFADHAPRWARELIGSILFRAEVAANSLVIASMRGLVQRGFWRPGIGGPCRRKACPLSRKRGRSVPWTASGAHRSA